MVQQPLVGQGILNVEASRSHSDTPLSVVFICTSDQPISETSTWQHTTLTKDRHPYPPDSNPQSQTSERPQTHALDRAAPDAVHELYKQRITCYEVYLSQFYEAVK